MKSKLFIYFILLVMTVSMIVGFSSSDPRDKDLTKRTKGINPEVVYGPALDNPISTLNESFEGTAFPPAGWTKLNPDLGPGWNRQTVGTTPIPGWVGGFITAPPGGQNAVAFCTWTTGGATRNDQWLVTPQLTNMQPNDSLSFWIRWWPSNIYSDTMDIKISTTTPTVPGFTINVATIVFPRNSADTNWTQYKYRIGNLVATGANIHIAFRERVNDNINDGASLSLDLVSVTSAAPPPICAYSFTSQTSGTTSQLQSVSAVSDMVGWAAGVGAAVRRTTNGGSTWTSATGTGITGDVHNIYALNRDTALCTTTPAATFIYRTTNGGTTWTQVFTQAGGFIDAIQMISATEGYALGDPVGNVWQVLKTTNGGVNWAQMPSAPAAVGTEAGWNNAFYILGTNMWFGTSGTRVYRSTNLGLNWSSAATTGTANTYSVHYNSVTTGLAGGNAVVRSTDGGATYTQVTSPGTAGNINGIDGFGNDFWAIRGGADIYRSTNVGTNWTTAHTQTGAAFQDIDFAVVNNCPTGWVVGNSGAIVKMSTTTGISNYNSEIPSSYSLNQNYPNPFNPSTNINFSIPKSGTVTLKIYDMLGKEVTTLVDEFKNAGNYIVGFNASDLPSGSYFYRVTSGNFVETKKMLLIK